MSTLAEDILGAPAGSYIDREVDRAFVHDGTGVLTREAWLAMGHGTIAHPERCSVIFDHIVPANNSTTAHLQHELREFAREKGMQFYEGGCGICHQVMGEGNTLPGEIIVGADSHSCTGGAFGAFSTGIGATEMAAIWLSGSTWFKVPSTIAISLEGSLPDSCEAKDIALQYIRMLGMDGGTYKALEFIGDGAKGLTIDSRMVLSNMAVEAGAKAGLFAADKTTKEYLSGFGHSIDVHPPQENTSYEQELSIDLSGMEPLLAVPHRVDTVVPVKEKEGLALDQVFIGTCTNGRYEDLETLAAGVKGQKVQVRTILAPASRRILERAIESGVLQTILAAGIIVLPPGCGPCLGAHMGVLGEGEVGLSTANRNFKNRMGVGAEYYLSSVATAAASAIHGVITVPGGN